MGSGIFFPLCAIPFSILMILLIIIKENAVNIETKIYKYLLVSNFFGLILELLCTYASYIHDTNLVLSNIIYKTYLLYLILWTSLLTYYIYNISTKNRPLKSGYIPLLFIIVSALFIYILPIELVIKDNFQIRYTTGPSVYFSYFASGILVFIISIMMIINRKNLKNKKYIPVYIFYTVGTASIIIQSMFPQLLLITYVETLICVIMYFTIENPDMRMIEQLDFAKSQAEKANNAKTDFLSNMSHEIRTPLNAIVGFSHSLEKEDLPESAREDVKYIISASDNLLDLVNGILDISKIEANKLEIVNKEYNTHELLDGLVALSKARLGEEKPIEFRYKFDESLPEYLYGDSTRLKQVIINLLTNSIKYTDEGFIEFKVDYIKLKDNIVRLIISVEDSGIGIKKENIDKLFNKFQRLDLEKNISIEGTGLGLAITKKLVNLMGGRIVVQSVYGKGSKFTVAVDQRIVAAPEVETFKMPEGEMASEFPSKRVLVVDDNKLNLKVAEKLLSEYKVVVECANSGDDAIEMVKNFEKYDIILMDDMMPHKSGSETLVELKQIPEFTVPVVALTANAIEGMKEKYLSIGFNDYLSKPIDKNELTRVLNTYLK